MFNGNAIYNPSGKAGEYARWACNLHVGCSNDCDYCYCKRGVLGSAMGAPRATLKKCFKDENDAYRVFCKELQKNADSIRREGGLFFSFSTDPCLPETVEVSHSRLKTGSMPQGQRSRLISPSDKAHAFELR